jgi:hypothetical protein
MPVNWIRRMAIASSAMVVLMVLAGLGIWFIQFLPRENFKLLLSIIDNPQLIQTYPLVKNAYESLHNMR